MGPELCSDKPSQDSLILHHGALQTNNNNNSRTCEFSKTITLLQQPEESATLNFFLNFSKRYGLYTTDYIYNFKYNFALTFTNNLHEVSNNYMYEINFYQYVHENELSTHTLLFSKKHLRKTNLLSFTEDYVDQGTMPRPEFVNKLLVNTDKRHMCLSVRRFNIKIPEAIDKYTIQTGHIGLMLFETGLYSDISLVAREKSFRVHKHILASVSDVFKSMFSHDMMENKLGKLTIEDFDLEIVEGLLLFIYTGTTCLLSKKPVELFQIAHKYEIQSLKTQCIEYFLFTLSMDNIVDMLYTASTYELVELRADLLKFVEIHEEKLVNTESFQQFLCESLKIDTLTYTLELCYKYKELLGDVKTRSFVFIKDNCKTLVDNDEFLKLFESHPSLMKQLFVFIHKND